MLNIYEYIYKILEKQFKSLQSLKKKVIEDKDIEDLHQMRVCLRKLRAAIACFKSCIDLEMYKSTWKSLKSLAKKLGRVRDLDVAIAYMKQYLEKNPDNKGVRFLLEEYNNRRDKRSRKLRSFLEAKRYEKLTNKMKDLMKSLTNIEVDKYDESFSIEFHRSIDNMVDKVYSFRELEDIKNNEEDLHSLRIEIKHLRYSLEFAEPSDPQAKKVMKILRTLQDQLGIINDCKVMNINIERVLEKSKVKKEILDGINKFMEYNQSLKVSSITELKFLWDYVEPETIKWLFKQERSV